MAGLDLDWRWTHVVPKVNKYEFIRVLFILIEKLPYVMSAVSSQFCVMPLLITKMPMFAHGIAEQE